MPKERTVGSILEDICKPPFRVLPQHCLDCLQRSLSRLLFCSFWLFLLFFFLVLFFWRIEGGGCEGGGASILGRETLLRFYVTDRVLLKNKMNLGTCELHSLCSCFSIYVFFVYPSGSVYGCVHR